MALPELGAVKPDVEVYWTTKQIAERLQCSVDCVKKWLNSGRLKKDKFGSATRISETSLQKFRAECTKKSTRKAA